MDSNGFAQKFGISWNGSVLNSAVVSDFITIKFGDFCHGSAVEFDGLPNKSGTNSTLA
jgi:hypothetical protein